MHTRLIYASEKQSTDKKKSIKYRYLGVFSNK